MSEALSPSRKRKASDDLEEGSHKIFKSNGSEHLGDAEEKKVENFNPIDPDKKQEEFRNYTNSARQKRVEDLYTEQHISQTYDFVLGMESKWLSKFKDAPGKVRGVRLGVWEALEYMDKIQDDSDPDTNLSQLMHALQSAEAIRVEYPGEKYDWFHLTGLIHDLGKIMAVTDEKLDLVAEPQWAVVGDTFPVGAPFSSKNVFPEAFKLNPDSQNPRYNQGTGIYTEGCGLFDVKMSWGHDEYLYQVCVQNKSTLPLPALYMIRYHSFYPWHKEGAYTELTNDQDKEHLEWIRTFNKFDLYSKAEKIPDFEKVCDYYKGLIAKYFPPVLLW